MLSTEHGATPDIPIRPYARAKGNYTDDAGVEHVDDWRPPELPYVLTEEDRLPLEYNHGGCPAKGPRPVEDTCRAMERLIINGAAAGLGFVIALTGDVCFASPQARFISAFSRLGLVAEYGVAWLLPRMIGRQRAAEILLSGRPLDAQEAQRAGIVHAVHDDVVAAAMDWARVVAAHCSPASLRTIKAQLAASDTADFATSTRESLALMRESFRGPDLAEALLAKASRRPPAFG